MILDMFFFFKKKRWNTLKYTDQFLKFCFNKFQFKSTDKSNSFCEWLSAH